MVGEGAKRKTKSTTGLGVRFAPSTPFSERMASNPAETTPLPPAMPTFGHYSGGGYGSSPTSTTATRGGASEAGASGSFFKRLSEDERQTVLPRNLRDVSYQGNQARFPASVNNKMGVGQILSNARKIIITKVQASDSIVELLDNLMSLEEEIEDALDGESEKTKIMVGLRNMDGNVCNDGRAVLRDFKSQGVFDFGLFITKVFRFSYPAPKSSLGIAFSELKQGQKSIVAYARQFKAIVRLLEYDIHGYFGKFILGLAEGGVRDAINCQNWENLGFDELVSLAVSISNNMRSARRVGDRHDRALTVVGGGGSWGQGGSHTGGEDMEEDEIHKLLGVPLTKYFEISKAKNAQYRCFNCFGKSHRVTECQLKRCVFCEKPVNVVKHVSLLCPKCPQDLTKYIEGRIEAAKKKSAARVGVRFTDDFEDYDFNPEELSDSD